MESSLIHTIISREGRTIPLVVDEKTAVEILSIFTSESVLSLEDSITGLYPQVFFYEKEEDKAYLSVKIIRDWITSISEKPYSGKNLYIIKGFDEATLEAMNASLKILEEPPAHAIILLVVKNPESLLETIRSRTMNYFSGNIQIGNTEEIDIAIEAYSKGDFSLLTGLIYSNKLDENQYLEILIKLHIVSPVNTLSKIEESIDALLGIHEAPRNIMEHALFCL